MELRTQLRVLDIISWCAFVLTVIVFCSPQWIILTTSVDDIRKPPEHADTNPLHVTAFVQDIPNADHHHDKTENTNTGYKSLHGRNNPTANNGNAKITDDMVTNSREHLTRQNSMTADLNHIKTTDDKMSNKMPPKSEDHRKTDVDQKKNADDRMGKQEHHAENLLLKDKKHDQTKHADDSMDNKEPFTLDKHTRSTVTIQAGLWFFLTCVRNETDDFLGKCYFNRYDNIQNNIQDLPAGMTWLRRFYEKIKVTSSIGLLEFRCEACIGLVFSFVGCLAIVSYKKSLAENRGCGIVACLSFFLSGGMIWTAVGKVATSIAQLQILYGKSSFEQFHVPVPACLIVGAIGATFTLGTAISLVFVLSRDRTKGQTREPGHSCHTKSLLPYHNLDQWKEDE